MEGGRREGKGDPEVARKCSIVLPIEQKRGGFWRRQESFSVFSLSARECRLVVVVIVVVVVVVIESGMFVRGAKR